MRIHGKISFQSLWRKALFEAAVDHGKAIQLMNETAQLEKILEDNPDFDKLMKPSRNPQTGKTLHGGTGLPVAESVMI